MNVRVMAIVGAATAAALGAWMTVRVRSRVSRNEDIEHGSGLGPVGQFAPFDIDDDRAAEIIHEFSPALQAVARQT